MADIKQIQIGSTTYNIDADKVDGKNAGDLSQVFRFGTTSSTSKIKIKINSTKTWMLCFTVTLYQGYRATKVMVSGYQYGSNYWYQPEARLLGDSDNTETISVYFGYDSVNNLWVGFDGGNYTGVSISDVTNGYTQLDNFTDLFTISNVSSLTTLQTTVTAASRANYANSAGNADTVDNKHASDFRPSTWTPTYGDVGAASAGHSHTYSQVGAASAAHTHSYADVGAASAGHTHSYSDVGAASAGHTHPSYVNPTSLPANGGNADTVDNKHASDFRPSTWTPTYGDVGAASAGHTHTYGDVGAASAGHTHSYIPLAGTTALAGSIVPTSNNTVDIGSYTKKIRYMYASSVRTDRVCQAANDSVFYVGMRSDPGVTTVQVEADGNIILSAPSVYVEGSLIKNAAFYSSGTFASAGHNHDGTYLKTQYTSTFSVYAGNTCVSTFNQSANRSITFSAGNNITLTGTAGGGVITISATGGGGGGWTPSYYSEANGYIYLEPFEGIVQAGAALLNTEYSAAGAMQTNHMYITDNGMYNLEDYNAACGGIIFHERPYEFYYSIGWLTYSDNAYGYIGRGCMSHSAPDALVINAYGQYGSFPASNIYIKANSTMWISATDAVSIYGQYGINIKTGANQYGNISICGSQKVYISGYGNTTAGGVDIYATSYITLRTGNNYRGVSVNGIPVVAGYEHNVYAYRDGVAAFTVQVITSNSATINTMAKLASQLYYAGYDSGAWCCNVRGLYGLGSIITGIVGCGTTYSDVCWQYVSTNSAPRPAFDQAWNTTNTGWVIGDNVRVVQR